ncbi:MAG: glycosyltransferase family 4 protein [Bacteroidota bacterium]
MGRRKLHILFINSWYPSKILPNNGDFIQRHAEAVATKHKVTAMHVITSNSILKNEITDENINGVRTLITYLKPVKNILSKQIQFFIAYKKLVSLSGDFDLVHVNRLFPVGIIAVWLKLFYSKPYIITEHFTGYLKPQSKYLNKGEKVLSKIITRQSSYVCPVSENLALNMQNIGMKGKYKVVENIVDTEEFQPFKKKKDTYTLIHVSSLVDNHKNITGILHVIGQLQNHLPDFLFYLIGDNPFQYQKLIDKLHIDPKNIRLIDQIPHQKVAAYIQGSDVMLMFSNYENLPCVILEAFSCGTKVISTDVGGISEHFPSDFGKLITAKDEKELLNSILELYKEKENKQKGKMHQYAKDHFSKEKISSDFSDLYYKILEVNSR